jgi:hypothetical protein
LKKSRFPEPAPTAHSRHAAVWYAPTPSTETELSEAADHRRRQPVRTGGGHGPLDGITEPAEKHDALTIVGEARSPDSVGPRGLGRSDHFGVFDRAGRVIAIMSTSLGGAVDSR